MTEGGRGKEPAPTPVPYLRLVGRLLRLTLSPEALRPLTPWRLIVLLLFVPLFLLLQLGHWVTLLLDEVLFPDYRDVRIEEPLFVVGMPRSGTSYLQRVLARDDGRFTTLRLWELMVAPSILERKIWHGIIAADRAVGRPGARLLSWIQRIVFGFMDDVHPVHLTDPEEDYFCLLPAFACFLLVLPFPEHPAVWALTRFDELPETDRRDIMALYRSCIQRHLYVESRRRGGRGRGDGDEDGLRWLSKNPSFTPMIGTLAETFPDARFVVCLRDPRIAIPSLLSSLDDGASVFGWSPSEAPHRERFVDMMEHFGDHAVRCSDELPDDRLAFSPLPRLHRALDETALGFYERFGWTPSPEFRAHLEQEAVRSRMHRSEHGYTLGDCGLDEEELTRRFGPLIERFDLDPETPE